MRECPFCGSDKTKVETKTRRVTVGFFDKEEYVSASVRCNSCHARGPLVTGKRTDMVSTKHEAARRWNNWTIHTYNFYVKGQ